MPVSENVALCMMVKNEQLLLLPLLRYLHSWVREIVVVDTGSIDATRLVARTFTDKVVTADVEVAGFGPARNRGVELVTRPWIFSVDADEWPTLGLLRFVEAFVVGPLAEETDGVLIWRENRLDGQLLGNGLAYEQHIRLFRSEQRYEGWLSEQVFVPRKREAPLWALLRHWKTNTRQARQDQFYAEYSKRHELVLA